MIKKSKIEENVAFGLCGSLQINEGLLLLLLLFLVGEAEKERCLSSNELRGWSSVEKPKCWM